MCFRINSSNLSKNYENKNTGFFKIDENGLLTLFLCDVIGGGFEEGTRG